MSHVIILAGSAQEANAYRRVADLPKGRAIHATSTAQILGVVPSAVHTLPGFMKRRDNHAVKAAVKRSSKKFQNVSWVTIDERGPLTPAVRDLAHDLDAGRVRYVAQARKGWFRETPEAMAALEEERAVVTASEAEHETKGRPSRAPSPRRSRCKDCNSLHFKDEPCPAPVDEANFFGGA